MLTVPFNLITVEEIFEIKSRFGFDYIISAMCRQSCIISSNVLLLTDYIVS